MTTSEPTDQPAVTLAERLLHHPHPQGPTRVELLVAAVPANVPSMPPLPAGATLIGSLVRWRDLQPLSAEVVLDAAHAADELLDAYDTELTAGGWSAFEEMNRMAGGFVSSAHGDGRLYRKDGDGPMLAARVVSRPGQPTDVRLNLDFDVARHMRAPWHGPPPGATLMPPLRPPAGVDMAGQSGGGSDGRWTSDATVRSDMPVAGLEGHFAEQLARAGWVRTGGGAGDGVAWSGWRVTAEEPWRAVLLVISPFESAHRLLSLRLEREVDGDGDGGGGAVRLVTA